MRHTKEGDDNPSVQELLAPCLVCEAAQAMIGDNRQLVTDEPFKVEENPVEVQDCRKMTDYFRGNLEYTPTLKGKPEDVISNERGVPNFSYELAEFFWRFPNVFAMIRTRYRLKIVKVGY